MDISQIIPHITSMNGNEVVINATFDFSVLLDYFEPPVRNDGGIFVGRMKDTELANKIFSLWKKRQQANDAADAFAYAMRAFEEPTVSDVRRHGRHEYEKMVLGSFDRKQSINSEDFYRLSAPDGKVNENIKAAEIKDIM